MALRNHDSINLLRRKFLEKFLLGVKRSNAVSESTSVYERKRAIKLSSDVAMASTRRGSKWSQALINHISKQGSNNRILMSILGGECLPPKNNAMMKPKMLRRSSCITRKNMRRTLKSASFGRSSAPTIAKIMHKRRTKLLKCVVPGGESMNEVALLEETADYIVSLRAQVDAMRHLAKVFAIATS